MTVNRDIVVRGLDMLIVALAAWLVVDLFLWKSEAPFWLGAIRPEDLLVATTPWLAARWWLKPPPAVRVDPPRAVAVGVVVYSVVFSFITVTRHRTFQTHALDLGQYAQNLFHIARRQEPYDTITGWHVWGNHLSPIFYLLASLTLVFRGPAFLLVVQSVALALGAVPLYLFARTRVGPEQAALFAGLYLLNPSLHGVNVRDFHPTAFAIPLLLTAMYAADLRRPALFWPAIVLTIATREDAAVGVVGLGLWLILVARRRLLGSAVVLVSVGWLFAAVEWIMPRFRDDRAYPYIVAHYAHLGDSLGAVLLAPIRKPLTVLGLLPTFPRLRYLVALLAPLAFLPLLAPLAFVAALPGLAQNLLSDYPVLFNHRTQYQSFVLPFLLVAAVLGTERLRRHATLRATRLSWLTPARALAFAGLASMVLSARTVNDFALASWRLSEPSLAAYRLLDAIPPGATVSAGERFFSHLYDRGTVFVFPDGLPPADYVLVHRSLLRKVVADGPPVDVGGVVALTRPTTQTDVRLRVLRVDHDLVLLHRIGD
jgi:uncharacterized membrane protein